MFVQVNTWTYAKIMPTMRLILAISGISLISVENITIS